MKNLNAMLLTAALSGLIGGTTVAANAATHTSNGTTVKAAKVGLRLTGDDKPWEPTLAGSLQRRTAFIASGSISASWSL